MVKFEEVDTSQTPATFPIEETPSFESLLNISSDEEVLPEATEPLLDPATQPDPWRPIVFESTESEIEALSETCAPPKQGGQLFKVGRSP